VVGDIRELVERRKELLLGRPETEIAHLHPMLDRPAKCGDEGPAVAGKSRPEHAHTEQLAVARGLADDPGARGAVAIQIAVRRGVERRPRAVLHDRDMALHAADRGMFRVDPAVDHGDLDPPAGAAAPGPFRGDVIDRLDPWQHPN